MKRNLALILVIIAALVFSCRPEGPASKRIQLPYNRMIQPAGMTISFGDSTLENHSMDAVLSPDGKWFAVMERYSIVFINTKDNSVAYRFANNDDPGLKGAMNTYSGIQWHKDGEKDQIWWSTVNRGNSWVASINWNGTTAESGKKYLYRPENGAAMALPNEILFTKEDGKEFLYVVLNGNNKVIKQDLATGDTIWVMDPGVAPYGITQAAGKIYVTNWAGRHPEEGDKEVAGIPWGSARVNNQTGGGTREGSVTVIDPADGRILNEIITGLHPNEIIADKSGNYIYVTNSNNDNISVISTTEDKISETISVRLQASINPYFGDSPDGLCLSHDGKTLYVANGMDNAIAVIKLGKNASVKGSEPQSTISGFIPTGAYPSAISLSNSGYLYVCNLEAEGASIGSLNQKSSNVAYNSHRQIATVSVIPVPGRRELKMYTDTVIAVNDLSRALQARETPRPDATPLPVPERIGEPSLFKHVIYIIKENRTYDQILGDMKKGDGDPALCIYGEDVTPNTHKLADEFILLDNFHVSGKCSAEGHQWTDASIVTDYIEKNMRAWFRSYPHVQEDALVYAPTGFLWDNGTRNGKKVRIYGEASVPVVDKNVTWTEVYNKFLKGQQVKFHNTTTIEPVRKILSQTYPSYGSNVFPDVMRADAFIKEIKKYEAMPGDSLPELMILALPNDHTSGTRPGIPAPDAYVADNDLALGRLVEAVTKSRFWQNTVIFVVEDDSQGGWDHVSAYRTVSLVISPYSRLGSVNHTYYTQPSMVRTIEQILGLPPMNIQDAIANPMKDCFSTTADLSPFESVPNRIPLDKLNPQLAELSGKALHYAKKSMLPEFDGVDTGNDDLLNRILWFAAKGTTPYPAEYAGAESDEEEEEEEELLRIQTGESVKSVSNE